MVWSRNVIQYNYPEKSNKTQSDEGLSFSSIDLSFCIRCVAKYTTELHSKAANTPVLASVVIQKQISGLRNLYNVNLPP